MVRVIYANHKGEGKNVLLKRDMKDIGGGFWKYVMNKTLGWEVGGDSKNSFDYSGEGFVNRDSTCIYDLPDGD